MRTVDMIKRIQDETGIKIHRVRVFHYVKNQVFEDCEEKNELGYRNWGEKEYARLKFAVLCSEVGIGTGIIKRAILYQDFKRVKEIIAEKFNLSSMLTNIIISNS